jgi:hypothetical protein
VCPFWFVCNSYGVNHIYVFKNDERIKKVKKQKQLIKKCKRYSRLHFFIGEVYKYSVILGVKQVNKKDIFLSKRNKQLKVFIW